MGIPPLRDIDEVFSGDHMQMLVEHKGKHS